MKIRIAVYLTFALILATLVGIPTVWSADIAKIGTVNFEKIFINSKAGKAARTQIEAEGSRMNADLEKIQNEIKALEAPLESASSAGVMNKDAIEDRKWKRSRKIEEVRALKKRYDRKIEELQMRLINAIRSDVLKIINAYGKKEGYLLIIEDINLVYAPQTIDITDTIIQMYNTQTAN